MNFNNNILSNTRSSRREKDQTFLINFLLREVQKLSSQGGGTSFDPSTLSVDISANMLSITNNGTPVGSPADLTLYLDDSNLARIVTGVLDNSTGIASFIRDDGSGFELDLSDLVNTVTASNGLTKVGNDIKLGGTLTEVTNLSLGGNTLNIGGTVFGQGTINTFTTDILLNGTQNAQYQGRITTLKGDLSLRIRTPNTTLDASQIGWVLTNQGSGAAEWQPVSGASSASNGLTLTGSTVELGGVLDKDTTINLDTNRFLITDPSTGDFLEINQGLYRVQGFDTTTIDNTNNLNLFSQQTSLVADNNIDIISETILINSDTNLNISSGDTLVLAATNILRLETPNSTGDSTQDGYVLTKINAAGDVEWSPISAGSSTGLEAIDEGNGIGWRLIGETSAQPLGEKAVDLSVDNNTSTSSGEIGASGFASFAANLNTVASNVASAAFGARTQAIGLTSFSAGQDSISSGNASAAIGFNTASFSQGEVAVGTYNTVYSPVGVNSFNFQDRAFVVGNGNTSSTRADAFTVLKSGAAIFHPVPLSSIPNLTAGMIISDSSDNNRLKHYDGTQWNNLY